MPQIDFDGANSAVKTDKIQGQSGTTVTITSGHSLSGSGASLTNLPAANITGTLPAIDGSNLTGISGDMVLLQTVTASDDATVLVGNSSLLTSTYRTYKIFGSNIHNATDNAHGEIRVSTASTVHTSNYASCRQWLHETSGNWQTGVGSASNNRFEKFWGQSLGNGTGESSNLELTLHDPASTDNYKYILCQTVNTDLSPEHAMQFSFGCYDSGQAAVDGIQFYASSGNITSGYFRLYGIK